MNFHQFSNKIITESQSIAQFLKSMDEDPRDVVLEYPEVKEFMKEVEERSQISPSKGRSGILLIGNMRFQVKIIDEDFSNVLITRTDNKTWDAINRLMPIYGDQERKTIVLKKDKVRLVATKDYMTYLNLFAYLISQADYDYRFVRELFLNYGDTLRRTIGKPINEILTTDVDMSKMSAIVSKFDDKDSKDSRSNTEGDEGKTIISFPNGWRWVDLERRYCSIEAKAAGHCGNSDGREDDNIISLRDNKNRIHITLVVNHGVIGEAKAPGNKKPKPYTHPYFVELLKRKDIIKAIGKPTYWDHNNFAISDLSPEKLEELTKTRPDIVKEKSLLNIVIQSRGDDSRLNSLIKQTYGVNIDTHFDKKSNAFVIDRGSIKDILDKWNVESVHGGKVSEIFNDEVIKYNKGDQIIFVLSQYFEKLPKAIQQSLKSAAGDMGVPSFLWTEFDQNPKSRLMMKRIFDQAWKEASVEHFNRINLELESADNIDDGFVLKTDGKGNLFVMAKMNLMEKMLINGVIEKPDKIRMRTASPDEEVLFPYIVKQLNALPFWTYPEEDKLKGQAPSQDFLQQKRREFMQQIEFEALRRELDNAMMDGTYNQLVQQLQSNGKWEEFVAWTQRN